MKGKSWTHFLLAALLVIIGGVVIGFAGETILKIKMLDGDSVEVDINGELTVINLDDLADGEEQIVNASDPSIVVKRVGDEFRVILDGNEMGGHPGCDGFGEGLVWIGEAGEHHGAHKVIVLEINDDEDFEGGNKVIRVIGDGDAGDMIDIDVIIKQIEGELGDTAIDIEMLKEHFGEHAVIKIGEGHTGAGPVFVKKFGGEADSLRFRCSEDGAELKVKKEDATQDSYLCPVCGRAMGKAPEVKMIHVMTTIETVNEEE